MAPDHSGPAPWSSALPSRARLAAHETLGHRSISRSKPEVPDMMRKGWTLALAAGLAVGLVAALAAGGARAEEPTALRVCGDPDNLPFSNEKREGFENKIADVIARDLGLTVSYFWWPHQRGLVRNTLRAGTCDVLISIPKGYDLVTWTKPYYRSSYVIAQLKNTGHPVTSLDDPALKRLKIGAYLGTPPYDALAERGLSGSLALYTLFFDPRVTDHARRPVKLLEDVIAGEIDVAMAWGPMAGYFLKTAAVTSVDLVPVPDDPKIPMSFEYSMGVAKGNQPLKTRLEEAIDRHRDELTRILNEYGVPLLPLKAAAAPPAGGAPAGDGKAGAMPSAPKHQE
jgi:mxaJ protein